MTAEPVLYRLKQQVVDFDILLECVTLQGLAGVRVEIESHGRGFFLAW